MGCFFYRITKISPVRCTFRSIRHAYSTNVIGALHLNTSSVLKFFSRACLLLKACLQVKPSVITPTKARRFSRNPAAAELPSQENVRMRELECTVVMRLRRARRVHFGRRRGWNGSICPKAGKPAPTHTQHPIPNTSFSSFIITSRTRWDFSVAGAMNNLFIF